MRQLPFKRHRFLADIIRHSIWPYARFTLSYRDADEMLAEQGWWRRCVAFLGSASPHFGPDPSLDPGVRLAGPPLLPDPRGRALSRLPTRLARRRRPAGLTTIPNSLEDTWPPRAASRITIIRTPEPKGVARDSECGTRCCVC